MPTPQEQLQIKNPIEVERFLEKAFNEPIQLYNLKKYYWILYEFQNRFYDEKVRMELASPEHPFVTMSKTKVEYKDATLLNWKEITEEEFNLFNQPK